jgi:hypothetical protein
MKENWAKNLKQKMAGFQQPVDDSLWAGIEQVSVKTGIRWWPWVLTALASAAVITIVLLLQPEPAIEPIIVSPGEMVAAVEEQPAVEEEPITETPHKDNTPTSFSNRPVRLAQIISQLPRIETEESFPPKNEDESFTIPDSVTQVETDVTDEWEKIIAEESVPQRNRVKISTSFYAQTSPLGNRYSAGSAQPLDDKSELPSGTNPDSPASGTNPDSPPGGGDNPPVGDPGDDNDDTKALETPTKASQSQPATAFPQWTHSFPLQIGARVSFSWNEHWSIDTGLTFIHFNSWNASTQQRMEFLGIPLYVNYKIGSARNFSFYASAGGQALKCFAGNAPDKPWLFSCGLGVGAEYTFSPLISIYAEPGADWYFHTGESRHYYTDNPFAFSLSLGFRLHF